MKRAPTESTGGHRIVIGKDSRHCTYCGTTWTNTEIASIKAWGGIPDCRALPYGKAATKRL
jgi:hypothetical protein